MGNDYEDFRRSLLAGALAGLTVDLTLYPLDTLKTRLQSREGFKAAGGFKNVYRGVSSLTMGSAPGSALFFVAYNQAQKYVPSQSPVSDAVRASFGEICACLVRVPTELIKQRAQATNTQKVLSIARDVYRKNGFFGFYKGYFSTIFREIPFSFIEFPLWEFLKRSIVRRKPSHLPCTTLESALCGSISGFVAAGITTPLDFLKTRIMLDTNSRTPMLSSVSNIVKSEGVLKLYSETEESMGVLEFVPNIIRVFKKSSGVVFSAATKPEFRIEPTLASCTEDDLVFSAYNETLEELSWRKLDEGKVNFTEHCAGIIKKLKNCYLLL